MKLRVSIFTETGRGVGLGHVRRCLALRGAAAEAEAQTRVFVAGDIPIAFASGADTELEPCDWIAAVEPALAVLDRWPADVVVVDSYSVTGQTLERLGARVPCLVLVDDLADRATPVDVVVNGGYHAARLHYRGRPDTVYLLGPRYALLDVEFDGTPERSAAGLVHRVLVTLGGAAPADLLQRVVETARRAIPPAEIDVAVGPFVPDLGLAGERIRVHRGLTSLKPLLAVSDLAITAGGMTLYECLATGTPVVAIAIADNQRPNVESLGRAGLLVDGGESLAGAIETLASDGRLRQAMSRRGRDVVDGRGSRRVVRLIEQIAASRGLAGRR